MANKFQGNPFESAVKQGKSPISAIGATTPHEYDSPAKIFMKAGKTFVDNVLKTVIHSKRQADAIASLWAKYRFFGWQDGHRKQEKINELMPLWAAIHGRASFFTLQAHDQVISERLSAAMSGLSLTGEIREDRDTEPHNKNNSSGG